MWNKFDICQREIMRIYVLTRSIVEFTLSNLKNNFFHNIKLQNFYKIVALEISNSNINGSKILPFFSI